MREYIDENWIIPDSSRVLILKLARAAVNSAILELPDPEIPEHPIFAEKTGIFVTIYKSQSLRGCIGYIDTDLSLGRAIVMAAKSAAKRDQRFPALTAEDLPEVSLEISLLSSLLPISPDEIVIGRHGLMVLSGLHRGVLLPQVAKKYGWDRTEFLQQVCLKAGLDRDSWEEGDVDLFAFSANVITE
ncbi:AmmeMemoRadiSam system protein A [bacterium]|nr:AmmeMemoRadiSam system protein A [bacterium]